MFVTILTENAEYKDSFPKAYLDEDKAISVGKKNLRENGGSWDSWDVVTLEVIE